MVHQPHGQHHFFHRRKRGKDRDPYLHPQRLKRAVDRIIYPVILFGILMTIPQILEIWVERNASGVSVISWSGYILTGSFWLLYGLLHREKPIILSSLVWICFEILIVAGALLYG